MLSSNRCTLRSLFLISAAIAISFTVYSQSAQPSRSFDSRSSQTALAALDREVRADMHFLADDELRGRGSATRDEHIAALFAASQFQSLGLEPGAPGNSYIQKSLLPDPLPDNAKRRISRFEDVPRKEAWNAIAILRGSNPKLKNEVILLTAHVDHLGVAAQRVNNAAAGSIDTIFNGADDDASGTTAILTLAHILATGPRPKRTIVFALFGSEEIGGFGAGAFLADPPVPLRSIVANLEFEMIGRPDPAVSADALWLTGYERSDLGPELAKHGAHIVQDPHPRENFFQRSDNIGLARQGIIAQTISSYSLHTDYHQPTDELKTIDFTHMDNAIASMIPPIRWLANTDWKPQWSPGGKPDTGAPTTPQR